MDMRTAREFTGDQLVTILKDKDAPRPVLVELDEEGNGRQIAVYTRGGRDGEPLGVLKWEELARALAEARSIKVLDGPALTDSGLRKNLRAGITPKRRAELQERRDKMAARLAELDEKLGAPNRPEDEPEPEPVPEEA